MLADEGGCWSHWAHNQDEELWMPLLRSLLSFVQNPSPAHTDDESSHLNQLNVKFSSQIDPKIYFHGDSKFKLTIEINHNNLQTISSVIWSCSSQEPCNSLQGTRDFPCQSAYYIIH